MSEAVVGVEGSALGRRPSTRGGMGTNSELVSSRQDKHWTSTQTVPWAEVVGRCAKWDPAMLGFH
jgi:hypothetical protein